MCGIFGIVSKPLDAAKLKAPRPLPEPAESLSRLKEALSTLDFYLMHQAYSRAEAHERWQAIAARLHDEGERPSGSPQLYRDVVWRIEHDLLDLLEAMARLLRDGERRETGAAVWAAWQVELTLRALGRLEVRGRDSAGISIVLWFEDEAARDRLPAGPDDNGQVVRHAVAGTPCLVLTYRVAEEVGALGYNESTLRALVAGDESFQRGVRANPVQVQVLAHTRWASNGIISLGNAHPVDGFLEAGDGGAAFPAGRTLGVLNGDVDNFLDLIPDLEAHGKIPADVTTDAKVIPALAEAATAAGAEIDDAMLAMMGQLEGSVATVLIHAGHPGTMWCGLKGTGQALYVADAGDAALVTSEVYGSAELTEKYWPLELAQERRADGHDAVLVRLGATRDRPAYRRLSGAAPIDLEPKWKSAEITTRDVDRRGFTHFFRKELEEAVHSVEKTIDGRYRRRSANGGGEPEVELSGLYTDADQELFAAIGRRAFRRFVFVGQGSAHVAGRVGSEFLYEVVRHQGTSSLAMTAGDFSAHELRSDLSDTCLVAISQSGTTTDTNRCLALARERGARVIGIVNRRNSAMVELCDAVIYTSDGRDVEMAVASTKAFYSQVVASFMLAQHVGLLTGALVDGQVAAALIDLERLPSVMEAAFEMEPRIAECARAVGLRRRHWSVLGSGASLATGEEIRIKISELCYKSVSVDILENKKHIDLSAEPLILAALHDLRSDLVSDAVKEVSIFAAHRAITVVMCDRDGDLYRSHTPYVLEMPPISHGLGAVTTALVGHLFAYHTAVAMDGVAQRLRGLRKALLQSTALPPSSALQPSSNGMGRRPFEMTDESRRLLSELLHGDIDALWPAHTAGRLAATFQILASDVGTSAGMHSLILAADSEADRAIDIDDWCRNQLSTAIADSTRSIDSIRHQAKTITVGTSRSGYSRTSVVGAALADLGVGIEDLPLSLHSALAAVDDMLRAVPSGIRYSVRRQRLTESGPEQFLLQATQKIGRATQVASRFDDGAPMAGTKLTSVRRRQPMVVEGVRDGARLLVFPILQGGTPVEVVLLHLELSAEVSEQQKLRFLQSFPQRAESLVEHFGEMLGRQVDLHELARLGAEPLLFSPPTSMSSAELS